MNMKILEDMGNAIIVLLFLGIIVCVAWVALTGCSETGTYPDEEDTLELFETISVEPLSTGSLEFETVSFEPSATVSIVEPFDTNSIVPLETVSQGDTETIEEDTGEDTGEDSESIEEDTEEDTDGDCSCSCHHHGKHHCHKKCHHNHGKCHHNHGHNHHGKCH
jgi:hypothetical protein